MDEPFELLTFDQLDAMTKGETMARLAAGHADALVARRQLIEAQCQLAEAQVGAFTVTGNDNLCGLMPYAEIPRAVEAEWRAKFVMEAEAANVRGVTGYECWLDNGREGFMTRFKKLNPGFFYEEQRKGNSVILAANKFTRVSWADMRNASGGAGTSGSECRQRAADPLGRAAA